METTDNKAIHRFHRVKMLAKMLCHMVMVVTQVNKRVDYMMVREVDKGM